MEKQQSPICICECPIERTLNLIGGKWKTVILWHLGIEGILRYGELRRRMPNITERMFSRQLKELISDGLIERKEYPQVPPKVEYLLTPKGQSLMPVLHLMCDWGKANT